MCSFLSLMFVFANCSISFQVHHSMSELMSVGCVSVFYFILLLQNVLLCLAIASSQLPSVVTFIIPFHRWCSPTFQIIHDLFCCLTRVIVRPLCALERVTVRSVARGPGYHFANSEPCLFLLGSWSRCLHLTWPPGH